MTKSMLIDTSKCMACRGCQVACKQWNQLPAEKTTFTGTYENPPAFTSRTWMKVTFREAEVDGDVRWYFGNQRCMHCNDAACILVCPVGAISHSESGAVVIDPKKCIGCNYCVANCTFNVMGFDRKENLAMKCTLCHDRTSNGLDPACVTACATGAIQYGDRSDLLRKGAARVEELRRAGSRRARLYGQTELHGTGVIFVLENAPEHYALIANPYVPVSARAWNIVFKPFRVLAVLGVAFGLWHNWSSTREIKEKKGSS